MFCADVEIQEGWQDDLEASAGWQSAVVVLDGAEPDRGGDSAGLDQFADGTAPDPGTDDGDDSNGDEAGSNADRETFTGTVVQPGNPVILDDGEETLHVETNADVHLGQEVTVRGRRDGETFVAEELR